MKAKPYVGITGIVNPTEAESIAAIFRECGFSMRSSHIPMMGFLVHYKTLMGIPPKEGKIPNVRYPNIEMLAPLMEKAKGNALSMVHYATPHSKNICEEVRKLFGEERNGRKLYDSGLCRALQINIPWPEKRQLEQILESFPRMQIVLQLSNRMMERYSSNEITGRIREYGECISHVLIDPSGGKGVEFIPAISAVMYRRLKEMSPGLVVGFAGGPNSQNIVRVLTELVKTIENTDFCIDTEKGVRTFSGKAEYLDAEKARGYAKGASGIFLRK